jgi:serine/threonine protein kinase
MLTAGSRLGGFEIVGVIGAGAMGVVYRARDLKLRRDVALKVLPSEFAADAVGAAAPDARRPHHVFSAAGDRS